MVQTLWVPFKTQIWVLKWNLQEEFQNPNFFGGYAVFGFQNGFCKGTFHLSEIIKSHPKFDILDDALMR